MTCTYDRFITVNYSKKELQKYHRKRTAAFVSVYAPHCIRCCDSADCTMAAPMVPVVCQWFRSFAFFCLQFEFTTCYSMLWRRAKHIPLCNAGLDQLPARIVYWTSKWVLTNLQRPHTCALRRVVCTWFGWQLLSESKPLIIPVYWEKTNVWYMFFKLLNLRNSRKVEQKLHVSRQRQIPLHFFTSILSSSSFNRFWKLSSWQRRILSSSTCHARLVLLAVLIFIIPTSIIPVFFPLFRFWSTRSWCLLLITSKITLQVCISSR